MDLGLILLAALLFVPMVVLECYRRLHIAAHECEMEKLRLRHQHRIEWAELQDAQQQTRAVQKMLEGPKEKDE